MTTQQFLLSGWTWNPAVLVISAAALAAYLSAFGLSRRFWYLIAALGAFLIPLVSPVQALADGYLFSAHMAQHILLLLVAPALLLMSLPRSVSLPGFLRKLAHPVVGWVAGVGAMWIWHAPALCNAAVSSKPVFALQTLSLLAMGCAFWWQVLAPRESQRLPPLTAILYLASSCIGCSVLGIIFTFSPVTVCSIYAHPADRLGMMSTIRDGWGLTPQKDQQLGGLLMWVPMCLVYLGAIFGQLGRWFSEPSPAPFHTGNA
jgi:cytochrome c oxidase assembly factor CtaG